MTKKKTNRETEWADAKRRCRLSQEDVRMAKELGLSPRSLLKNIPSPQQRWKLPVKLWIGELYEKMKEKQAKKQKQPPPTSSPITPLPQDELSDPLTDLSWNDEPEEEPFADPFAEDFRPVGPPDNRSIAEENRSMLQRQENFRTAAEYVARALSTVDSVQKVVLFGSVAVPLIKEVPRFREFRRASIAIYHECKDVDLAVWLTRLDNLKELQRARGQALNQLLADRNIGVAHHQVEIFVMAPETDRYLGRLCNFGTCPKDGKRECLVPHCGEHLFLRQIPNFFQLRPDALRPERTVVLYERVTA